MNLAIDNYRINPESQVMLADWAGDDDGGLDKSETKAADRKSVV